jgi:hypothetical protein
MKKFLILCLIFILGTNTTFVYAQRGEDQTSEFTAHGFNVLRIESEDKLWVPLDKADEVWAFMEQRFVNDKEYLKSLDPEFDAYWYLEEFWDTYYDTPTFQLLEKQSGVRHRRRINHTNPDHNKSGRELMQIKLNNIDTNNPLNRGEIKFDIEPLLKKTGRDPQPDDRHPMIGLVDPKHRADFKARLVALGLNPYSMKEILTVHDMRSRIYITKNKQPFMSISLDRVDTNMWWAEYRFAEIEPELNEIPYTEGDEKTRQYMSEVLGKIVGDIKTQFPTIEQNLTPKYSKSFNGLEERLPFFTLLVRTRTNNTEGMLVVVGGILALSIFLGYQAFRKTKSILTKEKAP